ncbi:MAG: hypothetical protein KGM43_09900, partial [Planctomycetota bacterium]|nr:hypothetical protein [Planctomycetota bacterium]
SSYLNEKPPPREGAPAEGVTLFRTAVLAPPPKTEASQGGDRKTAAGSIPGSRLSLRLYRP